MNNLLYKNKVVDLRGVVEHFSNQLNENLNEQTEIKVALNCLKIDNINETNIVCAFSSIDENKVVITNDFYVIEGKEIVIKNLVEHSKDYLQDCIFLNKSLNEHYGTSSQVVGMGDVTNPTVNSNQMDGSGDIKQSTFPKKDDEDEVNEDGNLKQPLHFESYEDVGDDVEIFMNIPIARKAKQINEPFSCNTLEGITVGKKGDYLVIGIDKEIYPCDKEIFLKTYKKIEF